MAVLSLTQHCSSCSTCRTSYWKSQSNKMQRCRQIFNSTTWCRLSHIAKSTNSSLQQQNTQLFVQQTCCRCVSSGSNPSTSRKPAETVMNVFDRKAKRAQRDRAALAEDHEVYDYLKDEVSSDFLAGLKVDLSMLNVGIT